MNPYLEVLRPKLTKSDYEKLAAISHPIVHEFIAKANDLCNPEYIFICSDSAQDLEHVRNQALATGEETHLKIKGHTVHFDGYCDQARDKERTKFLVPKEVDLGQELNTMERTAGLTEIHTILKNIMHGHELYIKFYFCQVLN